MAVAEPGQFVAAEAAVPDEDEAPAGEADQQQPQQPAHQLGGGAVWPPLGPV